jgi:hypothetical protein
MTQSGDPSDKQIRQPDDFSPVVEKAAVSGVTDYTRPPSLDSQLKLKALYSYIDACDGIIQEMRTDIGLLKGHADDHEILKRVTEKLGKICLDADGWGFEELYRVAFDMQHQLIILDSGKQEWSNRATAILDQKLTMMSKMLRECENDYHKRLAISGLLNTPSRDESE